MALKIVTAAEPIIVKSIKLVIYGDAGLGKTSLGYSAKNPLLFDFDKGAHRTSHRKGNTVLVDNWSEVSSITADDLQGVDTVVIDTVGRALVCITNDLKKQNIPAMFQRDGTLAPKGWGKIANTFKTWLDSISAMGKDIVILDHSKEQRGKQEGEVLIRPDIQGGTKGEIYKMADQMGYLSIVDIQGKPTTQVLFTPTSGYHTKDTGGLGNITIPSLTTTPTYLGDVIQLVKDKINSMSAEQLERQKELDAIRGDCIAASSAADLNAIIASLPESHTFLGAMRQAIGEASKALPVTFDKTQGQFVDNVASVEGAA